jgi:hypothetical protein
MPAPFLGVLFCDLDWVQSQKSKYPDCLDPVVTQSWDQKLLVLLWFQDTSQVQKGTSLV